VSGGGTISGSGLFTAGGSAGGPFTVTASSSAVSGTASVTVTATPPSGGPAAPTNLVGKAISRRQIDLKWTDHANNEDGFQIHRKGGGRWWAVITTVGPNVTSFTDTTVRSKTTYRYEVRAYNKGHYSAFSNIVIVTTP
jgi:hypothetical protein